MVSCHCCCHLPLSLPLLSTNPQLVLLCLLLHDGDDRYVFPDALNVDYGEPVGQGVAGLCHETAPNSGVFARDYTKATVQMDCNTWTPTITMK